ncbi:hypothetical protein RHSIM_Rhsim08G0181100 [Rhododendron simsii]|uniref:RRM domain-containing protein n=1 Tax=Rhododendron simsii TaxID=118357 RepID=A0A834LE94_RHOSS|nr:hypothetical protein RHSIM_Rhsim08G0181100 [Rhododendron simsii]
MAELKDFNSLMSSARSYNSGVSASEDEDLGVRLFVGNLEDGIDGEKLAQLFQQAGVVEIAEVMCYRENGESRGFGFINMSTVEEADKAVEMFHHFATPRGSSLGQSGLAHKVFVANLPFDVDDERLERGKVVDARIVKDRNTLRSQGIGFIAMSTDAEMNDAIANLNGEVP